MAKGTDIFALDWVKNELDETLAQARQALESFAESGDHDVTRLRVCLTSLHQAHGTLVMLELEGVTLLADEMEQLAQALMNEELKDPQNALQALMQGILQLPIYLSSIRQGGSDSRGVVLPLVNEMRLLRGVDPLPGGSKVINLHELPDATALERFESVGGLAKAQKIRGAYQQILLQVLRGKGDGSSLTNLRKVALGLERICAGTPFESLWKAMGAFIESLDGEIGNIDADVVRLLRRVDAEIRAMAQSGAKALRRPVPLELVKDLIERAAERVADRDSLGEEIDEIASAIEEGPGTDYSGREAMQSAATALREELRELKDELDMFVRSDDRRSERLRDFHKPLRRISSTLSVLGFESSRALISEQVEHIETALQQSVVGDDTLQGMASSLVQIDENLAGITKSRGGEDSTENEAARIVDEAHFAVLREARSGLEEVKQAVVEYVTSSWDPTRLDNVPELMAEVRGALSMVPLNRPCELLERAGRFVTEQLQHEGDQDWEMLNAFADAISGIDYYLERLAEDTGIPGDDILNTAEFSLDQLGSTAARVEDAQATEPVADAATAQEAPDAEADASPVPAPERATPEEARGRPKEAAGARGDKAPAKPTTFPAGDEEGPDDEIVEIFVEEVGEILETISEWLPKWRSDHDDAEALGEVRRSFHTLKGSGRIVGAESIGELSWSIENMLNRIIDQTVEVNEPIIALVEDVTALMPALRDVFNNRQPEDMNRVSELMERADVYASGGFPDAAEVEAEEVRGVVDEEFDSLLAEAAASRDAEESAPSEEPDEIETEEIRFDVPVDTEDEEFELEMIETDAPEATDDLGDTESLEELTRDGVAMNEGESEADGSEEEIVLEAADEPTADELTADTLSSAAETPDGWASESQTDDVFDIFDREATEYLKALQHAVEERESSVRDETVIAAHTLGGSASMAGYTALATLAGALHRALSAWNQNAELVSDDLYEYVCETYFALERALSDLRSGTPSTEDMQSFVDESERLIASLADAGNSTDAAVEFADLSGQLLMVDEFLDAWRDGALDLGTAETIRTALHAATNRSQEASELMHLARTLLQVHEELEDGALIGPAFEALSKGHARLLECIDAEMAGLAAPNVNDVMSPLENVLTLGTAEMSDDDDDNVIAFPAKDESPEDDVEDIVIEDVVDEDADDVLEDGSARASGKGAELSVVVSDGSRTEHADDVGTHAGDVGTHAGDVADEDVGIDVGEMLGDVESIGLTSGRAQADTQLPEDADPEIVAIFFEEADEIMESLDASIHDWIDDRANVLYLENLLRALHTLKGGARLAGLSDLGDRTHAFESFLDGLQGAGALTDENAGTVQTNHDELATAIAQVKVAAGFAEPGAETDAPTIEEVDAVEPAENVVPLVAEKPAEDAPAPQASVQPQEMVRVSAHLLEQLVNLAGESSIVRARIQQGMNDSAQSLGEMGTTIERLKEQLRRLEIETEAQVLFRHDRGDGPTYTEFDPLEMDRYSQLQQLSRALSESASDMMDLKETLTFRTREADTLLLQQGRLNSELQEGLMHTRMVPFSRLLPRLKRIVRQVSRDLEKSVEFHAYNAEGELDRNVLERMVPPLEHMLRNAIDHGIESPAQRRKDGKPEAGRIDLKLSREASDVVIEISDDGAGVEVDSVREKAIERGLMAADADLKDDDILEFILAPGFTTAKSLTQISGRGVGMDVVHSEVKQLGGSISIASEVGKGTRITVRLPFTVSVNRALMVTVGDDQYALPLNAIEGIVLASESDLEKFRQPDGGSFEYAGLPYRVRYMGDYLGREYVQGAEGGSVPVVLVRSGDQAVAIHVDGVQGSREIVVKSLGLQFAGVAGISGATILGDGSVVVILDLMALIRAEGTGNAERAEELAADLERARCVMVVDDSVTVRKVTSRLLERQGIDVIVAKDGVEAIALLQERKPDIMLLDIEMPRMDGFEVARQVRHDSRLSELPIVMVSSRTGQKHKDHAEELGVNRFLGKPFQENELLETIEELVGRV